MRYPLILAALAVSPVAVAQSAPLSKFDYGVYYDLKSKETSAIVQTPITSLDKLKVTINAFAGLNASTQRAIGGFSATKSFTLDPKLVAYAGLAVKVETTRPVGGGFVAGFTLKF